MKDRGIDSFGMTDVGLVRNINQDSYLIRKSGDMGLFLVADGMGGHSHGEVASNELVVGISRYWDALEKGKENRKPFPQIIKELANTITDINREIYEKYNRDAVCGTTVVGLLVYEAYYAVISVGDSRVYAYKGFKLRQLSFDDIWDNLPEVTESMSQEQIRMNENRGKLIHAVGVRPEVNVHSSTGKIEKNQQFIICSDGLYKYCSDDYINKSFCIAFGGDKLQKIGKKLMEEVKKNGAKDNVTFILVAPNV